MLRAIFVTATLTTVLAAAALAQSRNQGSGRTSDTSCADRGGSDRPSFCEIREDTIGGINPLDVDAGQNGGIRIRGWDRSDVLVRTRIVGYASTEAQARQVVAGVRIQTAGGGVRAEGPEQTSNANWSVSFDLQVPRTAMLTLTAHNGGISIDSFAGTAKFHAVNGGISLTNVSGDIHGETTNGGVTIDLAGDHWDGVGLDVETRNGGIRMTLPEHYSAALETGTTHGGVSIDFPVSVQGRIGRQLSTTLGAGGARVRAVTTNGGVTIRRK